jgi:O-antigen/teichoic acid export membrane protein
MIAHYRVSNSTIKYLSSTLVGILATFSGILILKNQNILDLGNILKIHLLSIFLVVTFNLFIFFKEKFKLLFDFSHFADTFIYVIPLVIFSVLAQIYSTSDRFIINYFLGKDNVGLYSAGIQMAFVIPMIGQSIQLAWTPYVFERLTLNSAVATKKLNKITLLLAAFLIILTIAYAVIYPSIFKVFLPVSYNSVLNFYLFFIIAGLFQSLYWLYNPFLLFYEKNFYFIYITIIAATISLTLNLLFVSDGLAYVATTFALCWLIQFVLLLITISYVKNIKKIK